ncbi:MAG: MCE family protein, partial [Bacteroidales bacterium]|nr:MCE family protein [Bacteroidales bacterium]
PQVKQILPKLDTVLVSLNTLLTNPDIAKTLNNVEKTTTSLASMTAEINRIVYKDLQPLTTKINTLSDNFLAISDNLKEIDYAYTFNQIDSTLTNVKILTNKLNSKDNSLGLLLNDTDFYKNLNATTENAASLLKDLQTNPKKYVHFSIFGSKKD